MPEPIRNVRYAAPCCNDPADCVGCHVLDITPATCADVYPTSPDCCDTCLSRGDGIAVYLADGREAELCCNHAGGHALRSH